MRVTRAACVQLPPVAYRHHIEAALARVGITDERLAQVASDGLNAKFIKHIVHNGEIVDEREVPDWKSVHAFWRDLLMVKNYLGADKENAGGLNVGGLMIITGPVQVNTSHSPSCQCDECIAAWEAQARKVLEAQRRTERRELVARGLIEEPESTPTVIQTAASDDDDERPQ